MILSITFVFSKYIIFLVADKLIQLIERNRLIFQSIEIRLTDGITKMQRCPRRFYIRYIIMKFIKGIDQ